MQKKQIGLLSISSLLLIGAIFLSYNYKVFAANPNNSTPILFPLDTFPTQSVAGSAINYRLVAFDLDNDPLTFSMSPSIVGASLDPTTGIFTWTPNLNQVGTYIINFSVSDGIDSNTIPVTLTITTPAIVLPPVISKIDDKKVSVGETLSFNIDAYSPTGLPLTITAKIPRGANFDAINRVFTWTPTNRNVGTYYLQFKASDGFKSTSRTVKVEVKRAEYSNNYTQND